MYRFPEMKVRIPPSRKLGIWDAYSWVSGATTIYIWCATFGSSVFPTIPLFTRDGCVGYVPDAKVLVGVIHTLDGHD